MGLRDSRRSEKVRQRLKKESRTWINQASSRLTNPKKPNDIFDESQQSASSIIKQQAKKQNHFFRIGWRLVSLLLVIGFVYGIYQMWTSPEFLVTNISIKGLQRIPEDEVLAKFDLVGKQIFIIDPNMIEQILNRSYPELWDIRINLVMPNTISIRLIERQPMIIWKSQSMDLWIDAEGFLIPARNQQLDLLTIDADTLPTYLLAEKSEKPDASISEDEIQNIVKDKPQIKGVFQQPLFFVFQKKITPHLLTAILQLNAWMPDEEELLYEAVRGVGWHDDRGWDVFIGSKLESINDKMLMYETIIRQLDKEGIQPTLVSVEFLHAPYYRLGN